LCPWPACVAHTRRGRGLRRDGWYRRKRPPTKVYRYRCRDCGRRCSQSTFTADYYLKRPDLLVPVAAGLAACSAHRQIARSLGCAKTTVTRLAERIGRHATLLLERSRARLGPPAEVVVHDHFETFVGRQDHALGIGTAVGLDSWFVYDLDPAPHRGSGRRPDRKPDDPNRLARASRPYVASIRRTMRKLTAGRDRSDRLTVHVDGRVDYGVAVRHAALRDRVRLRVFPNPVRGPQGTPRSEEARLRDWAMFPVDALHQLLRHTCSDHKRETIAFGRRLESILGRAHLIAVWRNFVKGRSERKPDRTTPAMRVGLTDRPWGWSRVFSRRLFPARERPGEPELRLYEKRWTPGLPPLRRAHAG
jgi:transposase-like protein